MDNEKVISIKKFSFETIVNRCDKKMIEDIFQFKLHKWGQKMKSLYNESNGKVDNFFGKKFLLIKERYILCYTHK